MRKFEYCNILLLCAVVIVLIALQIKPLGFIILGFGLLSLLFCAKDFRKNVFLIYLCLGILGITPINTSTDFPHALLMGAALVGVVLVPYYVTKYLYKNNTIVFPSLKEKGWHKNRPLYLLFVAAIGYLLIPFMLRDTGSYINWDIQPGAWNLIESYMGLNFVGIWDELFFVCTVLAILQKYFPFYIANLAQAIVFTSFLYTLAFQGWCVFVIFIFALVQGYIFKATKSLLYILAIHLTVDLVLHLSLVHLHLPDLLPYFIT